MLNLSEFIGFKNRSSRVTLVRHPRHVIDAALLGADIATVPYGVMTKLVRHPLTDIGVERFLADWGKVKK